MDNKTIILDKWGFPLPELFSLAFSFYKQNSGKAIHLSYEDNLKLIAFKQQASLGAYDVKHAPELGVFDVIGRDRLQHWQSLGDMSREQAMEGFIDLLDNMCNSFRPYIEAVKQNRDEMLKNDLRRMEEEKLEKVLKEREAKEALEESNKEELQRRQLQDALNKQTYEQFKAYAEKQFLGNPEQQAVLVHQLQQEHYHQYMLQLHMQNQNNLTKLSISNNNNNAQVESAATQLNNLHLKQTQTEHKVSSTDASNQQQQQQQPQQPQSQGSQKPQVEGEVGEEEEETNCEAELEDYVLIRPADIWTRPDIEEFKATVSAGDGDGVLTIGHGDTVTVRVPTNANGKCIFWEFATDSFDIGFGVYFEWTKPLTSEVTVHVSDSDDEDDLNDEDFLSSTEDLEWGGTSDNNNATAAALPSSKPPISIIVPIYRRECFNEVYVGSHTYPGEGVYLLKFDNSYSIWRSKTLYYRVYYER